jgi:hypothetical protein
MSYNDGCQGDIALVSIVFSEKRLLAEGSKL